jgi:putative ABC transport system permease protein
MVRDGMLTVDLSAGESELRSLRIPAVHVTAADPRQIGAVLPPAAFTEAGFTLAERRLYAAHRPADLRLLEQRLSLATGKADVHLESGPGDPPTLLFRVLLGVALVLGLGGTFAATGLAAADMRRDLDTLASIGALAAGLVTRARPMTARRPA